MSSPAAYQAFKAALAAAPYTGLTDAQILAQTKVNRTVWQRVDTTTIAGYLGGQFVLAAFLQWAASPPSGLSAEAQAAAAELALAFNNPGLVPGFDMQDATTRTEMQGALAALVGASGCPITQTIADGILALAQTSTNDWQQWGFRAPPTQEDLNVARKL